MMAAAFDVQLGECFLQRRLNPCDLCSSVIFLHRGLGALDSRFGRSDVDLLSLLSHVGQDRDRVGFNLHKAFANCQRCFASILYDAQFAWF